MLSHILKLHNYAALNHTNLRVASEFSGCISDAVRAEMGGGTTLYFLFSYFILLIFKRGYKYFLQSLDNPEINTF